MVLIEFKRIYLNKMDREVFFFFGLIYCLSPSSTYVFQRYRLDKIFLFLFYFTPSKHFLKCG